MNFPLECLLKVFIVLHHSLLSDAPIVTEHNEEGLFLSVAENETINLICKSPGIPVAYCGFKHPTGVRYSYAVRNSSTYKCNKKLNVTKTDVGKWQCYIGLKPLGQEISLNIYLKMVAKLIAFKETLYALVGQEITLTCAYTEGLVKLKYCRFERPNGNPLNMREAFRKHNAIQGKYYLPLSTRINNGECSVTINSVDYEDGGLWTCVAGIQNQVYSVHINVIVESGFWKVVYITLIVVIVVLGGLAAIVLYVHKYPHSVIAFLRGETVATIDEVSIRTHRSVESYRI